MNLNKDKRLQVSLQEDVLEFMDGISFEPHVPGEQFPRFREESSESRCSSEERVVARELRRVFVRAWGQVQAVGFRPYVARLASEYGLVGFVGNDPRGVFMELQGSSEQVDGMLKDLPRRLPPLARLDGMSVEERRVEQESTFRIVQSDATGEVATLVPPDAATCPDCLRELLDPTDRRYRYPFINCTNCGPRYSIIHSVPYDRPETTMSGFELCPECRREYEEPTDRRFHAQPNACPKCGPSLTLTDAEGTQMFPDEDVIRRVAELLGQGAIVAVKGIGGFHLVCLADDESVVQRLRDRKHRESKPFALMVGDLDAARRLVELDEVAERVLESVARPIVLLPKKPGARVAPSVAPGIDRLGVMLPYTPVHTLLFAEGLGPLVMTSGNDSGEPLCFDNDDALERLRPLADVFLMNDRPIARPIDDSVGVWMGATGRADARVVPLRRGRGYVPTLVRLPDEGRECGEPGARSVLALGGDLKSTVCVVRAGDAIVSEHLGDLQSARAFRNFKSATDRLLELTQVQPQVVAVDLHPGYYSRRACQKFTQRGARLVEVQHHHTHVVSCMVDRGLSGPVIGVACDGTGYGPDGTIWGGEVLVADEASFERVGRLRPFSLVGGDEGARQTWRSAVGLFMEGLGDGWRDVWNSLNIETPRTFELVVGQLQRGKGLWTSSVGRLFDGVAALLGVCAYNHHEAEAPMRLQTLAEREQREPTSDSPALPVLVEEEGGLWQLDGAALAVAIARARIDGVNQQTLSLEFHRALARGLVELAVLASKRARLERVVLSGGVFSNVLLLRLMIDGLEAHGLDVYTHEQVPAGDGGLSLGQAAIALARCRGGNHTSGGDNDALNERERGNV